MLPMLKLRQQLSALLAADTTTLNQAVNANKISLINQPFTPNENLTVAALSFATFAGSTALNAPLGAMGSGIDPILLGTNITILAPAGGWRWVCTASPGTPEIIYGFALTDKNITTVWGAQAFPVPQTIAVQNDVVDLGAVLINFVLQPMS